jgi:hypothetical protein
MAFVAPVTNRRGPAPRRTEAEGGSVHQDVAVNLNFIGIDRDPHARERPEGSGETLGGRADEHQVEVGYRNMVFPYVYALHG